MYIDNEDASDEQLAHPSYMQSDLHDCNGQYSGKQTSPHSVETIVEHPTYISNTIKILLFEL